MHPGVVGILILSLSFAHNCSNLPTRDPAVRVKNGLIAFTLRDGAGRLQIFTQKPDGSNRRQLTFEGDNGRPDWSPDGSKIAFGVFREGKSWVAVMNADGSDRRLVVEGSPDPDWSPDGKQIAFSHPGASVEGHIQSQIWLMNADGSHLRQITRSSTFKAGPSWSPDGKQMVFILLKNPGSPADPQPQIGIMNADGTRERILTTRGRVNVRRDPKGTTRVLETADDANAPAWSPVDNRIAFWSGIETRYGQIWVLHSDGTKSTQLTEDPTHRNSDDPSWSPDGKKILFSTGRSGRNELWVMDADGKNERKLSDIDAFPFPGRASWQPLREKREERKAMGASVRSYSTYFRLNEDPISEHGKWITGAKDGMDWYDVITKNGVAFGAVTKGAYTDPTALLKGVWGKNQTVKAKVFSRNQTEKYYQEVEIRLRSTLSPHLCTGYEVFFRCLKTPNAYAEIVRWNGKVGDWTSLQKHSGAQYGVKDGDLVEATIVGNVIKGYINGVEVISAVDDTYTAGNPGMGFNYGVEDSNGDFGFTYYAVDSYNN